LVDEGDVNSRCLARWGDRGGDSSGSVERRQWRRWRVVERMSIAVGTIVYTREMISMFWWRVWCLEMKMRRGGGGRHDCASNQGCCLRISA